jgi:hypothetical protein
MESLKHFLYLIGITYLFLLSSTISALTVDDINGIWVNENKSDEIILYEHSEQPNPQLADKESIFFMMKVISKNQDGSGVGRYISGWSQNPNQKPPVKFHPLQKTNSITGITDTLNVGLFAFTTQVDNSFKIIWMSLLTEGHSSEGVQSDSQTIQGISHSFPQERDRYQAWISASISRKQGKLLSNFDEEWEKIYELGQDAIMQKLN